MKWSLIAVGLPAILTGGPCAPARTGYVLATSADGVPLNVPRMAWETSAFAAGTIAGERVCPDLVEASGGDQYPMRVIIWRPNCAPGMGKAASSRGNPVGVSQTDGLYIDVEPAPWSTDAHNREILAARAYGEQQGRPTPCGAGVETLVHGTCATPGCVKPLLGTQLLTDVPVVDLEVADLSASGQRQIVIAGDLGARPSCLSTTCDGDAFADAPWPADPFGTADCNLGGVGVLHPATTGRSIARADVWLLDGIYMADTRVGKPTWVRAVDTDLDGDLELLAAFGAGGVLKLEPSDTTATQPPVALTRLQAAELPACDASPAAPACWLYRDVRVSTDVDVVHLSGFGGAGPITVLVEGLVCAAPHTDPATCPQVAGVQDTGAVPPLVTARDARTGAILRRWALPGGAVPMSVQVVDGCGVASAGPCTAATERPMVLIGASTVERDPVYLLAQDLAANAATLHPLTSAPRAWYRDLDTLHPLLPAGGGAIDAATCAGTAPLPANVEWVEAKQAVTSLTGAGARRVLGACAGGQPVPPCPAAGAACFSAEPNERFVSWFGDRPATARFAVLYTGPQHVVLTDSFMGPGTTILWSPVTATLK
jgi:hypothetical protein